MPKQIQFRLKELMLAKERQTKERVNFSTVARDTGLHQSSLSRLSARQFERVSLSMLETLCEYFDCELSDLMILQDVPDSDETH